MNNSVIRKTMENERKHKDINLHTIQRRRNYLATKSNYHTTKFLTEILLVTEMKKLQILMSKPGYMGLSIIELSKTLTYEFWYDYVKPKYGEKTKLHYMNAGSFIRYIKTDDIYKDIAENVKTRFETLNYELDRLLAKAKNKKIIELMKDKLG